MLKKLLNEFKEFALRGNVVDMAVGVIIGAAFGNVVNAVIDIVIQPILTAVVPVVDGNSSNPFLASLISLVGVIINILVTALVLFAIIKSMNAAKNLKKKAPEAPATKICPFCQSEINIKATRCPHCTSELKK